MSEFTPLSFKLSTITDEVRQLVDKGTLKHSQHLYALCQYFSPREWIAIETELERNGLLMRDRIVDLIDNQQWTSD